MKLGVGYLARGSLPPLRGGVDFVWGVGFNLIMTLLVVVQYCAVATLRRLHPGPNPIHFFAPYFFFNLSSPN